MSYQKYTPEQIIAALQETKGTIYLAAERLGCTHQTIINYKKRYASVRAVMDQERGKFVDVAELKMYQAVQNGEPWAVALVLRTLGKDRGYVERQENENKHSGEIIIRYVQDWRDRATSAAQGAANGDAQSGALSASGGRPSLEKVNNGNGRHGGGHGAG